MRCQFLKITGLQIKDDTTLQKILSNAIYKYTAFRAESQVSQALSAPHSNPQDWLSQNDPSQSTDGRTGALGAECCLAWSHTQVSHSEVQTFSLLVQCAFHFSSGSPSVVQGTLGWGCPWDLFWESIFIIKLDLSAFSTFILSWVFNGVFQRLLDTGHWKRWDAEADTKIQLFYWARHEKACKNHRQLHPCHEFFYVRKQLFFIKYINVNM